jgi:hypothetical protein
MSDSVADTAFLIFTQTMLRGVYGGQNEPYFNRRSIRNRLYPVCTLLYWIYTGYLGRIQEVLTGLFDSQK